MKAGANPSDIRNINKRAEAGQTAKEISKALRIELKVVKAFMPKVKATGKD